MPRNSSSTSSSSPSRRQALRTVAWMVAGLTLLDLALGWHCRSRSRMPMSERDSISRYFDYGRSLESKLVELLEERDGKTQPLAEAGWIRPAAADQPSAPGRDQDLLVAVYGMSFAHQIGHAMQAQDPRMAMRASGGPGAPLSQCHALFEADRGQHQAQVQVLGILASSLVGTLSMSHMTWNFEVPAACLYPRYELVDGLVVRHDPPATDLAALRALMTDAAGRARLRAALQRHDAFFCPSVYDPVLDDSVIVRMMRRAYGQSHEAAVTASLHGAKGFTDSGDLRQLAVAIATRFVQQVRVDGALPVLLLIDDRGYGDDLDQVMAPLTSDTNLLSFSTHAIADPADPGNFVADGHFTEAVNERIAAAFRRSIDARLGRR